MNNVSKTIGWADRTWNPVTGCKHGCLYCYAARTAKRLVGRYGYPKDAPFAPTFHPDRLGEPAKEKTPRRIFVSSMGDLWGEWVPIFWQRYVVMVTLHCPQHRFLFLTKNPGGYRRDDWLEPDKLTNCWLGATVTNQKDADKRVPELLETGGNTYLSIEPLLGPVRLTDVDGNDCLGPAHDQFWDAAPLLRPAHIAWLIIGCQTGPKAVYPQREWIDSLVSQADDAGVPVFVKSNITKLWPDLDRREWPEGLKLADSPWLRGHKRKERR